jgi:hypothetical protein
MEPELQEGDSERLSALLPEILEACRDYDRKAAMKSLAALKQNRWLPEIAESLDQVEALLLNSEFEAAAKKVEQLLPREASS